MNFSNKPIIVAITGATGSIYGVTLLKYLKKLNIKTLLIISNSAVITIKHELNISLEEIKSLATESLNNDNIGATIASGSYKTGGMVIAPCSIKTLSSIANCYCNNLISRAADVSLKERRKLILMVRETPFSLGHIELMKKATENGAIIMPPLINFYEKPNSLEEAINSTVLRCIDLLGIDHNLGNRWNGDIN